MDEQPEIPVGIGDVLLDKYVVERVIGAGGMGVVVAVRHRELGELYAMKFMLPSALMNGEAVDRFVREARAAAKLRSEHVAKVHDVGRLQNGSPYMVMEFLKGKDLEGVLEASGVLDARRAAMYVMQACDAIAEAHEAGVVHRDLKPANLFLTKRANGSPCVKVLDFGISKATTPGEAGSMTRTTAVMGSPYYMSPEQMRSSKNVDQRTDIWALGVILYQLTTGRVPFPGETITEVCSGVLSDDPPPLGNLVPGFSPELDAVIRRCLQKNQEHRFHTARELAATLAPIAGATPGASGLDLRSAAAAAVAGTMMATSSPSLGAVTAAPFHPGQPSAPAISMPGQMTQAGWGAGTQPPPKKSNAGLAVAIMAVLGIAAGGGVFYVRSQSAAGVPTKAAVAATVEATPTAATATTPSAPAPTVERTSAAGAEPAPSVSMTATAAASPRSLAPVKTRPPAAKSTKATGGHGIF